MKRHTGLWGVLAGLFLMYIRSSLNGTPPVPLFVGAPALGERPSGPRAAPTSEIPGRPSGNARR